MERTDLREDERARSAPVSRPEPEVNSSQASMLQLQQQAGNAAVAQKVAQENAEQGASVGPTGKITINMPEESVEKEFGLGKAVLTVGGSAEYEISRSGGESESAFAGAGGLTADAKGGVAYQGEVSKELHKYTSGVLEGSAWKGKLGGETNADKGKLGLEVSLDGKAYELKFGFTFLEVDGTAKPEDQIKFATFETGLDLKFEEHTFTAADGTQLKVTPKTSVKVAIEPNYRKIATTLAEKAAALLTGEALIAGGLIVGGLAAVVGTLATLGDGEDEAKAIDNAGKGRDQIVAGFTAGALGHKLAIGDDFTGEGYNRGEQWRRDMMSGQNSQGIPVSAVVLNEKAAEIEPLIRASAQKTANQMMHEALVERYWEIHSWQRHVPWAEIDTRFLMLMEGQGFGRPGVEEGRTGGGRSVLPQ
ncbi:hypothetical protein OG474_32085 [Kribbella sp. NBC_01505]|uniref:hypothetical protein n=1 Tax=Kribbella sp. NBC_01505 TaxID=2903580 RepID=UPI003865C600